MNDWPRTGYPPNISLYSDGGVICSRRMGERTEEGVLGASRSEIGGTWAFVLVDRDDNVILERFGVVTPGWDGRIPRYPHDGTMIQTNQQSWSSAYRVDDHPLDVTRTRLPSITNNHMEFMALLCGLGRISPHPEYLRDDITVYTDSELTIGRFRDGWTLRKVPPGWVVHQQRMLRKFGKITYVHLDGHPTAAQLEAGKGKRGNPVSKWNVRTDDLCNLAKELYAKLLEGQPAP